MGITKILAEAQNLWWKLNLRGAILTSLSLQVFLIFFAPMRKRLSNRCFGTLLWLAYLVADSVAVYAFGLLSKAQISRGTSDSEADASGDLLAFWAPFLLLHLGGPDTITAFALEDNELWGRHLLNLLFQLGTACYVFYQSLPSNKLIVPTILVFIGGTIKYIERIRALYLASFRKFRGSLLVRRAARLKLPIPSDMGPEPHNESPDVGEEDKTYLNDRDVILIAFDYFTNFKGLLVDLPYSLYFGNDVWNYFRRRTAKDAFRLIEAELNFFYDLLYTKASVVHRPTGYLFRAISIGSIITAFALFYVLSKHGFHEYDIQITCTLLLGAVGLEFVALSMLIFSDWTVALLERSGKRTFIVFLLKFRCEGSPFALHILHARWSKSIFQYNLIDSRLRRWPKWIEKLLDLIRLKEFLHDLKSGGVEPYSDKFGKLIFRELKRMSSDEHVSGRLNEICATPGKWALEHAKTGRDCKDLLPSVCEVAYDESLLLWHIATDLCYNSDTDKSRDNHHREISKVLSDYMLHLLIKQPSMMIAVAGFGEVRFEYTCAMLEKFLSENISDGSETKERACERLLSDKRAEKPAEIDDERGEVKSVLFEACYLANELRKHGETKWVMVSEVWVGLLAYAAIRCRPVRHAQQLGKGGELVSLVWLLMVHLGLSEQF